MKTLNHTILLLSLGITLNTPAFAVEPVKNDPNLQEITNFATTNDAKALKHQLTHITKEVKTPETKADLLCAILVQADHFLTENPKPEKPPQINISPPGGGLSGTSPASIKDPQERAAYEKLLADNAKLAEQHRQHRSIASIRAKALNLLTISQRNGVMTPKMVNDAIDRHALDQKQKLTLKQEIATATNDRNPQN